MHNSPKRRPPPAPLSLDTTSSSSSSRPSPARPALSTYLPLLTEHPDDEMNSSPSPSSLSDADDEKDSSDTAKENDAFLPSSLSPTLSSKPPSPPATTRKPSLFSRSSSYAPSTPLTPAPPYSPPQLPPFPSLRSPSFSSSSSSSPLPRWNSFSSALIPTPTRRMIDKKGWVVVLGALVVGAWGGWFLAQGDGATVKGVTSRLGGAGEGSTGGREVKAPQTIPGRCDPYSPLRPGHLLLHPTSYSSNHWQPLPDGLPPCEPINWMDRLRRSGQRDMGGLTEEEWKSLEFLRGKSVVSFGDSVDRDQNEHFCEFVGGKFDMIHANDPISPPYPYGEERPKGPRMKYNLDLPDNRWPDYGQSRPYVCRVERLNFTTVNVFHYGFEPENDWLRQSPHFYPPSALEARFQQIVLPLTRSLFGRRGPSVFQIAPGFWDIMRQIKHDEVLAQMLAAQGELTMEKQAELDGWSELSAERRLFFEENWERMVRRVVKQWGGKEGETRVVFRALHQPRPFNNAPKNRVAVVDATTRSVVAKLQNEDLAAGSPERLSERLWLNNWGRMIMGYDAHQRDDVHPNPLPASWLQWNVLLEQVKVQDELEERRAAARDASGV